MLKPAIIDAFHGDTLEIRVAVYADNGAPFDLAANGLNSAKLRIQGLTSPLSGTITGNTVTFRLTPNSALPIGKHNFYAQISGSMWPSDKYTVAHGLITIYALPEV